MGKEAPEPGQWCRYLYNLSVSRSCVIPSQKARVGHGRSKYGNIFVGVISDQPA